MLMFCFLAVQSKPLDKGRRKELCERLPEWLVDEQAILEMIASSSPDGSNPDGSGSSFEEPANYKGVDQSPRNVPQTRSRSTCNPRAQSSRKSPSRSPSPDTSDPSPAQGHKRTWDVANSTSGQPLPQRPRRVQHPATRRGQILCSHKCFRRLVEGAFLDRDCPKYHKHLFTHQLPRAPVRHALGLAEFLVALRQQWDADREEGFRRGQDEGAYGFIFTCILTSHGYTFIGKGITDSLTLILQRGQGVYERLQPLQGLKVPVCLGLFKLPHPYYRLEDEITSILLLSWAGDSESLMHAEKLPLLEALREHGVRQSDIHDPNFCRCARTGQVMAIDFGHVTMLQACHKNVQRLKTRACIDGNGGKASRRRRLTVNKALPAPKPRVLGETQQRIRERTS